MKKNKNRERIGGRLTYRFFYCFLAKENIEIWRVSKQELKEHVI